MGRNYDEADRRTYAFGGPVGAAIDADAIFPDGYIIGPAGKRGRLVSIEFTVTIVLTGAGTTTLQVGIAATRAKYGTLAIPTVAADNSVHNASVDLTSDANLMPADTAVTVGSDGVTTTGDGIMYVTIDWF